MKPNDPAAQQNPGSGDGDRPAGSPAGIAAPGEGGGLDPAALRYDERGLVPVVVQDVASGAVLMLAYADRRAVELTLATGEAHFFSRSRQALWRKGETSGNTLAVVQAVADCDGDALLLRACPSGPTCHRGTRSCFEPNAAALELGWLAQVAAGRRGADPERSYTARLLAAGVERVAQKVGEEAVETVVAALAAAARPERRGELVGESCDLLYHLLVLLLATDVPLQELAGELVRRSQISARGITSPKGATSDPAAVRDEAAPAAVRDEAAPAAVRAAAAPAAARDDGAPAVARDDAAPDAAQRRGGGDG
jgi:phosphoribosyl-ATP pyrophosphohydrolase/phosphoribosyl-AMP cyclohydrolase